MTSYSYISDEMAQDLGHGKSVQAVNISWLLAVVNVRKYDFIVAPPSV